MMKTGDIVLVPFPFAVLNNRKVRPAVVISLTADKYVDIIIAVKTVWLFGCCSGIEVLKDLLPVKSQKVKPLRRKEREGKAFGR